MDGVVQFGQADDLRMIRILRKRARGKVVLLGFDLDRVAGVFTSVEKALEELGKTPDIRKHNWWLSFRKTDKLDKGSVFDRVLLKTTATPV